MIRRWLWAPALLTIALAVLILVMDAGLFFQGWLVTTLAWGALPLGAMAILMVHGLTGGRWGEAGRPVWLSLAATIPLFALSMAILLPGIEILFSWTRPAHTLPEVVQNKRLYLNEPFFIARAVFYVLLWLWLARAQGVWSQAAVRRGPGVANAPGLILWVLAVTFFGFDWLMSLEPTFYSDVFGLMLAIEMAAAAMAVAVLFLARRNKGRSGDGARRDIANLWLGLLLGWAFMAFSQYIIIWSGNLPDEIGWYLHRREGLWRYISVLSFGLFFLVPFCVLLSGAAKGSRRWLTVAAVVCLTGHVLQVFWLVLPAFQVHRGLEYGLLVALAVAVGAGYLGCALYYHDALPEGSADNGASDAEGRQHV